MKIEMSPPDMTTKEASAAYEAVLSGWITTGPRAKQFEKEISEYCGAEKTACLNSATACLEMSLRVLGIGPGDEVITSAYSYTASASVIEHVGATIVLADCEKDSPHIDMDAVERAITEKTKAIIPVDIGGVPVDYDRLFEIVETKKHLFKPSNELQEELGRIAVVADCAHSFGARYNAKNVAFYPDFACFSFHAVKNLTTAEGGAVCFKSIGRVSADDIYRRFMLWSLHGQNKDALAKTKLGSWEYDIVIPGYKCNMPDILAAVGLAQLSRFDAMTARRRELMARYDSYFNGTRVWRMAQTGEKFEGNFHLCIARIEGIDRTRRDAIIVELAEKGISVNVHFKPLPMMTAYKNLGFDIVNYKNAFSFFCNEITLPLYSTLDDEQADYAANMLLEVIKQ